MSPESAQQAALRGRDDLLEIVCIAIVDYPILPIGILPPDVENRIESRQPFQIQTKKEAIRLGPNAVIRAGFRSCKTHPEEVNFFKSKGLEVKTLFDMKRHAGAEKDKPGIFMSAIPLHRPSLGSEEVESAQAVLSTPWLGMGDRVLEFERALEGWLGAAHVCAVSSGTSALHVALAALGVGRGDEVILPSLTFIATAQAVVMAGATPVFCEVRESDLCMDVEDAARRITPKTRAFMPVHYGGVPCDIDGLKAAAAGKNISIVEDAAHAFGSTYKGAKIGTHSDAVCFSFDPIKTITCGEGGAVATSSGALAEKIGRMRMLGIDRDSWSRYGEVVEKPWRYSVVSDGFRCHMNNLNAAIGLRQLKKAEAFIENKRKALKRYNAAFAEIPQVEPLAYPAETIGPFNCTVKVADQEDLLDALTKKKIGCSINYIPNHRQNRFLDAAVNLPVTESVARRIVSLPMFNDILEEQVDAVVDAVRAHYGAGS